MSEKPEIKPAPAVDPKLGMAGKLFVFKQNALKAGMGHDDVMEAIESFQSTADVETALALFNTTVGPEVLKEKQKETLKAKLNKAGTPPDKLPGSSAELQVERMNAKAASNLARMNIMPGACPAFRYNPESGDLEVL